MKPRGSVFTFDHGRQRPAQGAVVSGPLPDGDHAEAFAALVLRQPPVLAISLAIAWPDMAADPRFFHLRGDRFAELVGEDKGGFVLNAEVARQGQHALAFDLVAKNSDRRQIVAQVELVVSKQRSARRGEILAARGATKTRCAVGARTEPTRLAAAFRAHRRSVRLGPTDFAEHAQSLGFGQAQRLSQTERLKIKIEFWVELITVLHATMSCMHVDFFHVSQRCEALGRENFVYCGSLVAPILIDFMDRAIA